MPRSPRPLLLGALLALLAAVAWWLATRDAGGEAPTTPPAPTAAAREPAAPASSVTGPDHAAADGIERTEAPAGEAAPAAVASASGTKLHGTIVVTDASGAEHASCSGTLRLALLVPRGNAKVLFYEEQEVAVIDGKWEVPAPRDAVELQVSRAELDGRPARCRDEIYLVTASPPIALRAHWILPLRVRVLADDTGADLGDVRVVQANADCPHPGNNDLREVLAHAKSPLQIPNASAADEEYYWMCSPGYAWNQIRLATTEPGERVLRLLPGGDVDVTIVGTVPDAAVLRVRSETSSDNVFAELTPARTGATRIDGLPAGKWVLFLEKGPWYSASVMFGATTATVATGTVAAATIEVRSDADVQRPAAIEVRGTLRLPRQWFDIAADMGIERDEVGDFELEPSRKLRAWYDDTKRISLGDMTEAGDGSYRWGPVELPAGRWNLLVEGTQHRVVVEVGPHSPTLLDVVVPEPCDVRVRVLDATSGEPMTDTYLSWFSLVDGWDNAWSHVEAKHVGDGWYRFCAPPGRIKLGAHPDGYSSTTKEHVVRAGSNELELRIGRACGVEVTLKDGDMVLPFPEDGHVDLVHTTTKSGVALWSGNKITVKEPGEHVLTVQPLDGFLPIEPRRVMIEPAKWTQVEIVLQRKP